MPAQTWIVSPLAALETAACTSAALQVAALMVTARLPNDALYLALKAREREWQEAGIRGVKVIGDANAPAPIAWATYAGHRYAEELDEPDIGDAVPFKREIAALSAR